MKVPNANNLLIASVTPHFIKNVARFPTDIAKWDTLPPSTYSVSSLLSLRHRSENLRGSVARWGSANFPIISNKLYFSSIFTRFLKINLKTGHHYFTPWYYTTPS